MKTREELDRRAPGRVLLSVPFEADEAGIGAPGRVILQEGTSASDARYVVHWQNRQDGGCSDGGYYDSLADALFDLAKRVAIEEGYAQTRGHLLHLEVDRVNLMEEETDHG